VTAAVAAAPEATAGGGGSGPFDDGTYLINVDIQAGNYRCSDPVGGNNQSTTRWITRDSSNNPMDAGGEIASLPTKAYLVELENCIGEWTKIG
jgi:hypothetical protein